MNWTTETDESGRTLHTASCTDTSDEAVQAALHRCADHAFALLDANIQDDSMYCLFVWDAKASSFSIIVTDEKKSNDAKHAVTLLFPNFSEAEFTARGDAAKYWITDYLTTCPAFLAFSLLAGFVRDSRAAVELM